MRRWNLCIATENEDYEYMMIGIRAEENDYGGWVKYIDIEPELKKRDDEIAKLKERLAYIEGLVRGGSLEDRRQEQE